MCRAKHRVMVLCEDIARQLRRICRRRTWSDGIWVMGGQTIPQIAAAEPMFHREIWTTADGLHWKQHLAEAPWSKRQMHEVAVFDDKLWILEGWNQTNHNDVWYSVDGVEWNELPDTPWKSRHAATVFVHDDSLWMVAGNNMQPDVWRLRRTD